MASKGDNPTETSPLVVRAQSSIGDEGERGQATVSETVLNLSKTCMGTGCLALAYGCQQGGVVVYCLGLIAIAAWNVYAVDRLVRCRKFLQRANHRHHQEQQESQYHDDETARDNPPGDAAESTVQARKHPPESTSTLGKVAFFAFGPAGLEVMDVLMIILLMGIVISYLSAVISFLSDTPLTIGPLGDALVVALLMVLLSLVPDLGHLAGISGAGLLVLGGTFAVISGYGLVGFFQEPHEIPSLPMWPVSNAGLSHFFGVSVFGFGTVPLTYNFQESMKQPKLVIPATVLALGFVAVCYIVLGVGLSILFPAVTGEVLHELPSTGWLPTLTRLAMAVVVVLTAPLLIVPTGELLEGKFHGNKVIVRCGICLVSVVVAVLLPTFVQVLSFVGCACVGFVSFCVPPILHIRLSWKRRQDKSLSILMLLFDVVMLLWGMFATVLGTILTLG